MECGQNYNQRHLGLKVIQLKLIHLNHINISLSQFEIRVSSRWFDKKIGKKKWRSGSDWWAAGSPARRRLCRSRAGRSVALVRPSSEHVPGRRCSAVCDATIGDTTVYLIRVGEFLERAKVWKSVRQRIAAPSGELQFWHFIFFVLVGQKWPFAWETDRYLSRTDVITFKWFTRNIGR